VKRKGQKEREEKRFQLLTEEKCTGERKGEKGFLGRERGESPRGRTYHTLAKSICREGF